MAHRVVAANTEDNDCDCSPGRCSCSERFDGARTYNDPTVSDFVTERFRKFYMNEVFTDVLVTAGKFSVRAHKLVLAASSTFFQAQFSFEQNSISGTLDEIQLPCDGSLLKDVIEYIYSGTITITRYNVIGLMELQDYLQVACLRNLIDHFVRGLMTESSDCFVEALKLKEITECYRYHDLASDLFLHIRKNFKILSHTPEFLEIPLELFLECLNSDFLVVGEVDDLLITVCKWVSFDQLRSSAFDVLLSYVDPSEVVRWNDTKIKAFAALEEFPDLRVWLCGWFCGAESRRFASSKGGLSRYKTVMKPVLMSIGGLGEHPSNCSLLEASANTLPSRAVDCTMSWSRENWKPMIPTVNSESPGKDLSVPVPLMKHPRAFPIVAYDGFNVYVAGGGTNSVEMYSSTQNQWFPLPDVPPGYELDKAVLAVLNGSLYLLGARATDDWNIPGSPIFMVLHKDKKSWSSLTPPDINEMALINSSYKPPYLVGSLSSLYLFTSGQTSEAKMIRKYDVDFDLWSTIGSHPASGWDHICGCVAFSHAICVIFDKSCVFMYNTATQEWTAKGHRNSCGEDNNSASIRYSSYSSAKFGCEIVLADESVHGHLYLYTLSGRRSTWLNQRRPYCGLAQFHVGLYDPPSI